MPGLFDQNAAMMVIAGLVKDPDLIHDSESYKLTVNDFKSDFYKIIFGAIHNLVKDGAENINIKDIDLYIGQYKKQYEKYKNDSGYEFLNSLEPYVEDMDKPKFNIHYNRLKKFTILRSLEDKGIDTKEFYNPDVNFLELDKQNEKLNNLSIENILDSVKEKLVDVENLFVSRQNTQTQSGSKGIRELYEELKVAPEVGEQLDGDIYNFIVRGARFGKMYINSAPSGHGKTRSMVGAACGLSMPRIEGDEVVIKKDLKKIVFFTTEQKADEIQTLILAYVSGVNESKILLGNADPYEEKLLQKALDVIEEYGDNFQIESMADPSIALIKTRALKFITKESVEYIFYDYIFSSPGLLSEFRDLKVREDVALMMLSNTLKEVAAEYDVFIMSGTQLNDGWSKNMVRTVNHVRGSKAIGDKVDVGTISIMLEDVPEEKEIVESIIEEAGLEMPNMVMDVYKNRRGELKSVKLYRYFDHGTCRVKDIMLTTSSHKVIDNYHIIEYENVKKVKLSEFGADKDE